MRTTIAVGLLGVLLLGSTPVLAQTQTRPSDTRSEQRTTPGDTRSEQRTMPSDTQTQQRGTTGTTGTATTTSQLFNDLAEDSQFEYVLSQLALLKASNSAVVDYAQRIIDDHSRANSQLLRLARKQNITVPVTLDTDEQQRLGRFQQLSGNAFDSAYISEMQRLNQQSVQRAQNLEGQNAEVRQFLNQLAQANRQHLQAAQQLETRVSTAPSGTTGTTGSEDERPRTSPNPSPSPR